MIQVLLCGSSSESIDHLFLHCYITDQLCNCCLTWWDLNGVPRETAGFLKSWNINGKNKKKGNGGTLCLVVCSLIGEQGI